MIDLSAFEIIIDVRVGKIIEEWMARQGFNVIAITKVNPEMADLDYKIGK
jgi:hypothetical protein